MIEAAKRSRRIGACVVALDTTVEVRARYAWHVFDTAAQLHDQDPLGVRFMEAVFFRKGMPAGVFVRTPLAPTGWRLK